MEYMLGDLEWPINASRRFVFLLRHAYV